MPFHQRLIYTFFLAVCLQTARGADDSDSQGKKFFSERIRPILVDKCQKCHGAERSESDLRVDSYEEIMEGGVSGDFVLPGKPDESLLIIAVSYKNEDLQMPPDGKLSAEEIEDLRQWVRDGASHPDAPKASPHKPAATAAEPAPQPTFWAFQTPVAVAIPAVRNEAWVRNPIDRFVLAKLESAGIAPRPPADSHVLARRLSFGLIGLPPAVEDIDQFAGDHPPDTYDRYVDRLLNSPHYGERWGRHWLDVARYADSNGLDENVAHGNAWRYRDYVINAWNQDKPFDRFVCEQIAGDLLPATDDITRHEHLVATGFLSLGAKVLAEVDERKMEMDIVDEQIDTVGRTFLSLTLGCARCHDHKFDPISTEDYYALAGIFRSTKTMETFTKVAKWHENTIGQEPDADTKKAFEKKIAERKAAIQRVIDEANKKLVESSADKFAQSNEAEKRFPAETQAELKKLRNELAQWEKAGPPIPSAMGVADGKVIDTEVCIRGSHLTTGRSVPRNVPAIFVSTAPRFSSAQSGRLELAQWLIDRRNPLTARVIVNRIWRWHFGRGLVESTDNFGQLGDRPANQPLLDWLAVWFMDHDWSIKELQRLIVSSATFRQDSLAFGSGKGGSDLAVAGGAKSPHIVDPDNRLLWHFPIRRLEAEAIRDALLAVSEQLDSASGGSLMHVGNREYLFDHTSKDDTRYDSRRRSVYLPVVRNNLYDVFELFDSTDATVPSGDRSSSTVATQALFMLNSPLMLDAARQLANIVVTKASDEPQRISHLYRQCFGRTATPAEQVRAAHFLIDFKANNPVHHEHAGLADSEAWTALAHVLLASNEFIYVR